MKRILQLLYASFYTCGGALWEYEALLVVYSCILLYRVMHSLTTRGRCCITVFLHCLYRVWAILTDVLWTHTHSVYSCCAILARPEYGLFARPEYDRHTFAALLWQFLLCMAGKIVLLVFTAREYFIVGRVGYGLAFALVVARFAGIDTCVTSRERYQYL